MCESQIQQPIVFHATMNDYFNPIGENQILVYDSLITNIGMAYDQYNGLFKAPYDGLYQFIATSWSTDGHYLQFEIVQNNQDICYGRAGTHDQSMGICAAIVELSRGDKVWVRHQGTRGDYAVGKYYPSFAGHLIL
ncbi:hypothetical protein FSP39_008425 [Pinctada imbricata]|uniref:C1q domain-containing protein n=1 Tax=Pinctada imbricata TaxID=66713 RepID=A0AA88YMP0_PINIB|nr:hypothetical protein FSP39_008425 [Pinctada imbricata]